MSEDKTWTRSIDFLFACAGGAIGLGNVWRFPYICFSNGGGAFLIPYLLTASCIGIPLFFLESALGQLTGADMLKAWKIVPIFKGIGYATLAINLIGNSYFNVVLAWLVRYLIASFNPHIPWISCNNTWNTENCSTLIRSTNNVNKNSTSSSNSVSSPIEEYWERKVLQLSNSVEDIGSINTDLALCLLGLWIVVYFCIWKGFKWSSKVVYFTVPLPFLLLFVVLIKGLTLDGASTGIHFYLKPNMTKLATVEVWVNAVEQVCYSYTLCWGMVVTLASRNKFHHNFYRDSVIMVCLNAFTSLISGLAVFSVLGFMSQEKNISVADVVKSGPGLAFIAYPQALALLPLPHLWNVLFFVMILLLSLDSLFVCYECAVHSILNSLPVSWRNRKWSFEILLAFVTLGMFLITLPLVTKGGYHVFRMFEFAASGWCVILIVFCETMAIGWVIGADRYLEYASVILKKKPIFPMWFKICWKFIVPIATLILVVLSLTKAHSLQYSDKSPYPTWAEAVAWLMLMPTVLPVPVMAIHHIWTKEGDFLQRLKSSIKIREDLCKTEPKEVVSLKEPEPCQPEVDENLLSTNENNL